LHAKTGASAPGYQGISKVSISNFKSQILIRRKAHRVAVGTHGSAVGFSDIAIHSII
jgi:hypothetical protein